MSNSDDVKIPKGPIGVRISDELKKSLAHRAHKGKYKNMQALITEVLRKYDEGSLVEVHNVPARDKE